jgi:hypothetical protein
MKLKLTKSEIEMVLMCVAHVKDSFKKHLDISTDPEDRSTLDQSWDIVHNIECKIRNQI